MRSELCASCCGAVTTEAVVSSGTAPGWDTRNKAVRRWSAGSGDLFSRCCDRLCGSICSCQRCHSPLMVWSALRLRVAFACFKLMVWVSTWYWVAVMRSPKARSKISPVPGLTRQFDRPAAESGSSPSRWFGQFRRLMLVGSVQAKADRT